MNGESDKWHQVILLRVLGLDVEWDDGPICYVENRSLSCNVIAKARQVDEFVKSTGLLKNHKLRILFDSNGVAVEVVTSSPNDDLFSFTEKLQIIKDQLHSRFTAHRESIQTSTNIVGSDQAPEPSPPKSKSEFAEKESIHKLLAGPTGARLEIDFGSKKEIVASQINAPIYRQIIDEDVRETLTADVQQFNDTEQKITFTNVEGVKGLVTLDVDGIDHRRELILAQLEYRRVVVTYAPSKNPSRPDQQARSGKLISIDSLGEANEKLL